MQGEVQASGGSPSISRMTSSRGSDRPSPRTNRARGDRLRAARDRAAFSQAAPRCGPCRRMTAGGPRQRLSLLAGPHGKPYLEGAGDVEFNLSHSGDLALVAVARGVRVGVDVERVRDLDDRDAIARRFFSPRERDEFTALPDGLKTTAFFRLWTCKESYIKCIGTGLSSAPRRLLGLGRPARAGGAGRGRRRRRGGGTVDDPRDRCGRGIRGGGGRRGGGLPRADVRFRRVRYCGPSSPHGWTQGRSAIADPTRTAGPRSGRAARPSRRGSSRR